MNEIKSVLDWANCNRTKSKPMKLFLDEQDCPLGKPTADLHDFQIALYNLFKERLNRGAPPLLYILNNDLLGNGQTFFNYIIAEKIEEGYISHPVICKVY